MGGTVSRVIAQKKEGRIVFSGIQSRTTAPLSADSLWNGRVKQSADSMATEGTVVLQSLHRVGGV